MNKNSYILFILLMVFSITTTFAQQNAGALVITSYADSVYTTGAAGEFSQLQFEQGQTVNWQGMYTTTAEGPNGTEDATEVNINYTIFLPGWGGTAYEDKQIFADATVGSLDGQIDFDYTIPMDADTFGMHDDSGTGATQIAYMQCRVVFETLPGTDGFPDVFWYEFVQIRPAGTITSTDILEKIDGLEIYPNPADNEVMIETPLDLMKNVQVYDMTGKLVLNLDTQDNRLDVSQLASGFHFIKIEQDGKYGGQKIMIK